MKILTPWPGCMKRILNGKKEWKKYWAGDVNEAHSSVETAETG